LYSSLSIIRIMKSRRMRWAGHVARKGKKRNAYRLSEGKRPLGRPRLWRVDNIRVDLGEVGWGDGDLIALAQDRNRRRALVRIRYWTFGFHQMLANCSVLTTGGLSSSAQLHRNKKSGFKISSCCAQVRVTHGNESSKYYTLW
jgi:hypothetical protein